MYLEKGGTENVANVTIHGGAVPLGGDNAGSLRCEALGEHILLAEAGRRLSLSPQAVEARVDEGLLHAIRVDGDLLVRAADLMDY